LKADAAVTKALPPRELEALFDLAYHLKHVDTIFARVFGKGSRVKGVAWARRSIWAACSAFTCAST
jgi:hypothetical protein